MEPASRCQRGDDFTGAVQRTTADASAAVATTAVGADGTVGPVGVTAVDAIDDTLLPTALVAMTVNVYGVPFVRPVTVHDRVVVVHARAPGDDVTV